MESDEAARKEFLRFVTKAACVVGLHTAAGESTIVICADEEMSINALAAFDAAFTVNILVAIYGPWSTDRRGVPPCA